MEQRKAPPLAVKGDKFKGKRSGKLFTVVSWHHNLFGGHDTFVLQAEDGEEKQVASFRLLHKYERIESK